MDLSPAQEAAAMHGIALNRAFPLADRLQAALQALAFYEADREQVVEVVDQWRVSGDSMLGYPYEFVYSAEEGPAGCRAHPEQAARAFMTGPLGRRDWVDGPHLDHRQVRRTSWVRQEVQPGLSWQEHMLQLPHGDAPPSP